MPDSSNFEPHNAPQIMVSSTYTDLVEHRAALIKAIEQYDFHPNVMEYHNYPALEDVIEASLNMVRESAGYILLISRKYGQIPECPDRNPNGLSITELEFNEAMLLKRPILLFIMDEEHLLKERDMEQDTEKKRKLNEFRERAKKIKADSSVQRIFAVFESLEDFKEKINRPLSKLREHFEAPQIADKKSPSILVPSSHTPIPVPPALYAKPNYVGSHRFVGRESQLQDLDEWTKPADPTQLLLFEAIGGSGKSMLTWHWVQNRAEKFRSDWAGRFWYSFYESGAVMDDFCRRALAYMTRRPMDELKKLKTREMEDDLLAELHARPWLLILDGLERLLVAYHRFDAAEVPDEEANAPTDKILHRDPCNTICDEDGDLLRLLTTAAPSKILVSSRLTPRVLLNPSGQPIPGVKSQPLPGLRPADAEEMFRACGVTGNSERIQDYLTRNCDNHPLVIGALAGLVVNYLPKPGDFDAWEKGEGAELNLADLNLIQRRNHILRAAIDALDEKSAHLLSTLALISGAVDYETLKAFNPHLPPEPAKVEKPKQPVRRDDTRYLVDQKRWQDYENGHQARKELTESEKFIERLHETVKELKGRGLLQYDGCSHRYDLHPVVRGVAAGGMRPEELNRHGQRVVDYFSSVPHNPYGRAQTLEDIEPGLHVVRTLLKLGRFQEAADAYVGDLSEALFHNLEAYTETLVLLRSFFPDGWDKLPENVGEWSAGYLTNNAAMVLSQNGNNDAALAAYEAGLRTRLKQADWNNVRTSLRNIAITLNDQNAWVKANRLFRLGGELAAAMDDEEGLFKARLDLFIWQAQQGQWDAAEETQRLLNAMDRPHNRVIYHQGDAEYGFAIALFWQGRLQAEDLDQAMTLAEEDNNRVAVRLLGKLRGAWRLERGEWGLAAMSLGEAVHMARERRLHDASSEAGLVLAKFRLGQLDTDRARQEAERLSGSHKQANRWLAELWRAIGDEEQAQKHALAAYKWAWADGEPYVDRYELTQSAELLGELNVPLPDLLPYDPAKDTPFPWEADIRAGIEKLKAEKVARKKSDG